MDLDEASSRERVIEVARLFLRLGLTAFGGPAAHVAIMREEVVERRRWLTAEEFLDLLGATNFIPGPNSTEMAIHIGHRRAGKIGLVVAGCCFILPAVLLTLAMAWGYVRFGHLPEVGSALRGIKPVVVAVVVHALLSLGRTAVKSRTLAWLGIGAVVATVLGANEIVVLFGTGIVNAFASRGSKGDSNVLLAAALPLASAPAVSTGGIFVAFLKIGSVLFGSGYVLLAFLRADLVENRHWLTESQLLDAVAAGQVTPGPVFSTATFVGYVVDGFAGAGAATAGIFLPAFFFVAISAPLLPRLRRSLRWRAVLDGVNVASLALMATVAFELGRAALVDVATGALALGSAFVLLRTKVSSTWLVVVGGVVTSVIDLVR